jgi:hypothetical protein
MIPLTMEYLENCFNRAKELNQKYVAIIVTMKGFPSDEIIINSSDNFDDKLAYYKNTYDENLKHKFADVKITGFTFGNSFAEIEEELIG